MRKLILLLMMCFVCSIGWCGMYFDNQQDIITTDLPFSTLGTAGTVSAWVRYDSVEINSRIFELGDDSSVFSGTLYSNKINFWGSNSGFDLYSNNTISTGTYYHVVCVWDETGGTPSGADAELFVDAVSNDSDGSATVPSTGTNLRIGARKINDSDRRTSFHGLITDIAVWDVALTQVEITQLYNRIKKTPLQIRPSNLIAYFPLDDIEFGESGNGDTFRDISGNGYTGTGNYGSNASGLLGEGESFLTYP